MKLEYIVNSSKYKTVKEILKSHFHISNRLLIKLKRHNKIFVNGSHSFIDRSVHENDCICVDLSFDETSQEIVPTKMNLDLVFEDASMLLINKPAGLPIHPSITHFSDTLSNGVQSYFEENHISTKIRPVTRLDKDTSGLVIFAKNEYVQQCLIHQMADHSFQKYYLAILEHTLSIQKNQHGTLDMSIARKPNSIIEREINKNGQIAITHYRLIQNYENFCLVEFELLTGRTHQIRVHAKYFGHPILGDSLYGSASEFISRQALHCYKLLFTHPITNEKMMFEIDLPKDMKKVLQL